jgi:hypothetical protein
MSDEFIEMCQRFLNKIINKYRLFEPIKLPEYSCVQSFHFNKNHMSELDAVDWLHANDYSPIRLTISYDHYIFKIIDPIAGATSYYEKVTPYITAEIITHESLKDST